MKKKHILFVTTHVMSDVGGGNSASRAFFDVFVESGNSITAIIPEETETDILSKNNINYIRVKAKGLGNRIKGAFSLKMHRYHEVFKEFLKQNHTNIDFIVFTTSILGDIVKYAVKYNIECVTIHHNVDSNYYMNEGSIFTLWGTVPWFVNRRQKQAWQNSTYNFTLTETDYRDLAWKFKKGDKKNTSNIGCFEYKQQIKANSIKSVDLKKNEGIFTIVITGNLSMKQSIDGVLDFFKQYLPLLDNYKNISIEIAGRNPHPVILKKALSDKRIKVIPNPIDMAAIVKKANLFLCPIKLGSGIKLRIMDGLQNNIPILTHIKSAKGYESFSDFNWFQIYENESQFLDGFQKIYKAWKKKDLFDGVITSEYYKTFSFDSGFDRIKKSLPQLFQ